MLGTEVWILEVNIGCSSEDSPVLLRWYPTREDSAHATEVFWQHVTTLREEWNGWVTKHSKPDWFDSACKRDLVPWFNRSQAWLVERPAFQSLKTQFGLTVTHGEELMLTWETNVRRLQCGVEVA